MKGAISYSTLFLYRSFENQFMKIFECTLPQLENQTRMSDIPVDLITAVASKKALKKLLQKGLVQINNKQAYSGDYLVGGEIISILRDQEKQAKPQIDIQFSIDYEDDYLAIINKPAGVIVSGNQKWTLENALHTLTKSTQEDALERAEPIHRLDYLTSGALLIGKTNSAVIKLNKLFENREIQKEYFAATIGKMEDSGFIETSIEGKACKSEYTVKSVLESERYGFLNLVLLVPHTGRRNQLRIHMLENGTPILGDTKYAKEGTIAKGNGLYLHSNSLAFTHPFTQEYINVNVELPKKFKRLFSL